MKRNKLVAYRWCLLVQMVVLLLATCATATEVDDVAIRAMTFNIRYDNPNDGDNAWPHRKDIVAKVIGQYADIAGLQEVTFQQLKDLRKRLPNFESYGVGRDDGKNKGEFSPVLFRRDRFEIVSGETFWLSETPDVPGSRSWDSAITRIVTVVRFRDRATSRPFYFLNTHFDHKGAVARSKSAAMIRDKLTQLDAALPIVVTGDFNCTPDQKPYQVMIDTKGANDRTPLFDAHRQSESQPTGPNSTWNGFRAIVPDRRIDFIFVGPGVQVSEHQTLDMQPEGRFPSDHLPVVADLRIAK